MQRQPRVKYLIDEMQGHTMIIQGALGSLSFYTQSKWKKVIDVSAELAELRQSLIKLTTKLKKLEAIPLEVWRQR
jgi:hypothetical protein